MTRKLKILLVLSTFLLSMCRSYENGTVVSINGFSCQNYTDYGFLKRSAGAACFYVCPDGTVAQPHISENFSGDSSLFTAARNELDSQFCSVSAQVTATESLASTPATPLATASATARPIQTATMEASPTAAISSTAAAPLLTGEVTMCDQTIDLISFRILDTSPGLTDELVTVQISEQETTCAVNPVNTSLLTCTLPTLIAFPASVVARLDGAVVNEFQYDGVGCILVDTPIPNP
ncbi:MAG TPA: hypothetical protein VNA23_00905 [Anaerolineales bacterium]|nr:hypothetical protein [Anaerolineales bacterium]